MMRFRLWGCLAIALTAFACGGGGDPDRGEDPGDTLTEAQATQAFDAMGVAIDSAVAEVQRMTSTGGSGEIDASAACAQGGSVAATGEWVTGQSLSLDLGFDGCRVQGVTIDGELSYEAMGGATRVDLSVEGQLDFSGAVTGSCGVDMTVTVTSAGTEVVGMVCGFSVDASGPSPNPGPRR
jgi:hypothetical protein